MDDEKRNSYPAFYRVDGCRFFGAKLHATVRAVLQPAIDHMLQQKSVPQQSKRL
jgi:hypothetical protein